MVVATTILALLCLGSGLNGALSAEPAGSTDPDPAPNGTSASGADDNSSTTTSSLSPSAPSPTKLEQVVVVATLNAIDYEQLVPYEGMVVQLVEGMQKVVAQLAGSGLTPEDVLVMLSPCGTPSCVRLEAVVTSATSDEATALMNTLQDAIVALQASLLTKATSIDNIEDVATGNIAVGSLTLETWTQVVGGGPTPALPPAPAPPDEQTMLVDSAFPRSLVVGTVLLGPLLWRLGR